MNLLSSTYENDNQIEEIGQVSDDSELNLAEGTERKIIWQAKDWSIREFQSMEQDGTLDLRPTYQRKFVMDLKMSSRLIESILMDVPIPVVYLAEEKDGTYSVIDGQQRLTSFISFVNGKLPDGKEFVLQGLKVLSELNKKKYSDLDKILQTKVKTTTLHTIIIKRESQEDIKFEIFERLNTGSIRLNEDEIRNTVYRGNYINLLAELEENELFHKVIQNERAKKRMSYRGMILRFFAIAEKTHLNYKPSIKQFCNKELRDYRNMSKEKQHEYREKFKKCLDLVYSVFGTKAFRRFTPGTSENPAGKWNTTTINMALFDIQMCAFVNYDKNQIIPKSDAIREALLHLMAHDDKFIETIEISTSDRIQLQTRFKIWLDRLEEIVGNPKQETRIFPYSIKKTLFYENPTCRICGQQILEIDDAETDHILPFSEGGKTTIDNAQITHRYCNRQKNNRTAVIDMVSEQENLIDIFAIYLKQKVLAKFNPQSEVVIYNGVIYDSPSGAGSKAKRDLGAHDEITTNGWQFWKFISSDDGMEKYIDVLRN